MSRQMHGLTKAVEVNKRRHAEAEAAGTCAYTGCGKPASRVWESWDGRCTPFCEEHYAGCERYWARRRSK